MNKRHVPCQLQQRQFGMTKNLFVLLVASLGVVTPCFSESNNFSTEKPSPLKLASPRHGRIAHFVGRVQLSGRFFVGWELITDKRSYLRVIFFPDKDSMTVLPHAVESGPVKELLFPKAEEAASILLDRQIAQRILTKEVMSARGEAIVTVGNYRTVVECDHRWYIVDLISASTTSRIIADTHENGRFGC
jgi:hypothetical protein